MTRNKTGWGYFSFNPTVMRMADYTETYVEITRNLSYGSGAGFAEKMISFYYGDKGYYCWQSKVPYIRHAGSGKGN